MTSIVGAAVAAGACAAVAHAQVTVPYTEDFESFPTCSTACGASCVLPAASGWFNSTTDGNEDWAVDVGGTPSSLTGPGVDHSLGTSAGRYLYTEASGCLGREAELYSPVITVPGGGTVVASVWYHMLGQSQGTLHIDVIDDPNGAAVRVNDIVAPRTDDVDLWQQFSCVPLATAGGSIQVVIRGITGSNFYSDMAIDDFAVGPPIAADVGVSNVRVVGGCEGPAPVAVTLTNGGLSDLAGAQLTLSVNGTPVATEVVTQSVVTCGTLDYTFTAMPALTAGPVNVTVTAVLAGDLVPGNDSASQMVTVLPVVSTFPYQENFDGPGAGGWASGGTNSTWALGTPEKSVINSAQTAPNAWIAGGLTGSYLTSDYSYVEGPCFDISTLSNPRVEASVWWDSEFSYDGGQLQYSTDGTTWNVVGAVGDPNNWYNDTTVLGLAPSGSQHGWSGRGTSGSNGWLPVAHDLGLLGSGATAVRIRFAFGSDTSVVGEGFAFDSVRLIDNPPRVEVADVAQPRAAAALPGSSFNFAQAFVLTAQVGAADLTAISIDKTGTIDDADISGVRLWLDDGNGQLDVGADTMIGGVGTFSGGATTISFASSSIPPGTPVLLFVTYDLAATAPGGASFGARIADAAAITANVQAVVPAGGANGALRRIYTGPSPLPYGDDFEGPLASRTSQTDVGSYPALTSTTAGVISMLSTAMGGVYQLDSVDIGGGMSVVPNTGSGMAVLSTPGAGATSALDLHLDMTAFDPVNDDVFVVFSWNSAGQADNPEDMVFLSTDGGATWLTALYDFDFTTPLPPGWALGSGDLSGTMRAAGQPFTNDMVIRFQASGTGASPGALMIDDVSVSIPPTVRVERIAGMRVATGATDDLGTVPGASLQRVTYTIRNVGLDDLTIDPGSVVVDQLTNALFLGATTSSVTIAPGGQGTIAIDYAAPVAGPLSMTLSVQTNDPRLDGGVFTAVITGMAVVDPALLVSVGQNDVANGGTASAGMVRSGRESVLRLTLTNRGNGFLDLTTPAFIENLDNATATLASPPPARIGPLSEDGFGVRFIASRAGDFSFDVVIPNNDPNAPNYRVTIEGRALSPHIVVRQGADEIASGSSQALGMLERGVLTRLSYTIANTGDAPLALTGDPVVMLSGISGGDVRVGSQPNATLTAAGSSPFIVEVTPTADGPVTFVATIASDDPNLAEYSFGASGTGFTPAPEIQVSREGALVASGAMEDAGVSVPRIAQSWTYMIRNVGTSPLMVRSIALENRSNVQASVTAAPRDPLAVGASATFTVEFSASDDGPFSFGIAISSDDADEANYSIAVQGQGLTTAPEIDVLQGATSRSSGSSIGLGAVEAGTSTMLPLTIRNLGNASLAVSKVELRTLRNVDATVTQPTTAIAAGASDTFTVTMTPLGAGSFGATLVITNDDGTEGVYTLVLNGTATAPVVVAEASGCSCGATEGNATGAAWTGLALGLMMWMRRRPRQVRPTPSAVR